MPHWRPFRVDAETPLVGFCFVVAGDDESGIDDVNPVVVVPVTSYNAGSKLNMSPYFSVMPP